MPRAILTVTIPDDVWIGELTRRYPDATVRVLAAHSDGKRGVGLVELVGEGSEALLSGIERSESVTAVEPLYRDTRTGETLVQFETTTPLLLFPLQGSGVPLELPIEVVEGEVEWELTAPRHRLSTLGDQLDEFGIKYTVEEVGSRVRSEAVLTERQSEVVEEAVERGYYDTPRECTLTELAEELDTAKSTLSEVLHRAEGTIVREFVKP